MADRLYRSREDRRIAGVAGGLAELWDADPALVRILWALLIVFTGGLALVVYVVMALVVPEEDALPWPPAAPLTVEGTFGGATVPGSAATSSPGSPDPRQARRDAQAARRAARAPGRYRGASAPVVFGGLLIVLGVFFLAREFLPEIDFDWFGPGLLIALGAVILATGYAGGKDDATGSGGHP